MKYDFDFFDRGIDRAGTDSVKWNEPSHLDQDSIPLWVADTDFPCAQPIADAIMQRTSHISYGYTKSDIGDHDALTGYWKRRHRLTLPADGITMLPCVVTGLKLCVRVFTQPGDEVAVLSPIYGPFSASINCNHRIEKRVLLKENPETKRFDIDFDALDRTLETAKLLMICNPHNPVSRAWSADELESIVALAQKHHTIIVSDEIHADFVYKPNRFTPILSLEKAKDCCVMLCSASKTFNIAGLQQAYCVTFNNDFTQLLQTEIQATGIVSGNTMARHASIAAYTLCDDWLDGELDYLDKNRVYLAELLRKYLPKASLTPIEATFLAWVDMSRYGKKCDQLIELCRKELVCPNAGTDFGPEGEYHLRINFGCPRSLLEEGIIRIARALEE